MKRAILPITNYHSLEIRLVDDNTLEYKYSTEETWKQATIQFIQRRDEEITDLVPGFTTDEDIEYFLDEFMVID